MKAGQPWEGCEDVHQCQPHASMSATLRQCGQFCQLLRFLRVFSFGALNSGVVGTRTIPPYPMLVFGACTPGIIAGEIMRPGLGVSSSSQGVVCRQSNPDRPCVVSS